MKEERKRKEEKRLNDEKMKNGKVDVESEEFEQKMVQTVDEILKQLDSLETDDYIPCERNPFQRSPPPASSIKSEDEQLDPSNPFF